MEEQLNSDKLVSFRLNNEDLPIKFVETIIVKEGVVCDTYAFDGDDSRDLAIVRVASGASTPLQKVLKGDPTVEGYVSGVGKLVVSSGEDSSIERSYIDDPSPTPVTVAVGQTMQWTATGEKDLVFYEICTPPYQDGRFEDLTE